MFDYEVVASDVLLVSLMRDKCEKRKLPSFLNPAYPPGNDVLVSRLGRGHPTLRRVLFILGRPRLRFLLVDDGPFGDSPPKSS